MNWWIYIVKTCLIFKIVCACLTMQITAFVANLVLLISMLALGLCAHFACLTATGHLKIAAAGLFIIVHPEKR